MNERPAVEEVDFSKEVTGGIRSVFDRIGEFFNLFDLSFFVSGAATFAAVVYWFLQQETKLALAQLPQWVYVVGLAIACYICGLLSFASGRFVTAWFRRKQLLALVKDTLAGHGIQVGAYVDDNKHVRLYERLWVEVRQQQKHVISFSLLRRYWVMAATYDGVAISCLVWTVVLVAEPPIQGTSSLANFLLPVVTLGSALVSFYQGYSYFKYQVFELIATIAASKRSLDLGA